MFVSIWGVKNSICGVQKDVCFFWDGIGWNLHECIQRKSRWVTVISDGLDVYDMIYEVSQYLPSENESSHPTLWKDEKLTKLPKMWSSDSFFFQFPPSQEGACWLQKAGRVSDIFGANLTSVVEPRLLEVEWGFPSGEAIEDMAAIEVRYRGWAGNFRIFVYIYIHIYTRKPGRSPTRQYGVLRPFLTCAPSLDFFGCFKKIFLLATQNQANLGHQGEKRWMGSQHRFLWNKKAVSTEKSPGQRCSLAAAKTWTFFFFEEAAKRPTLFIRLRVPLMAPNRLSALLSPPATKKQRWVSLTRPCRRLAWDWSVFSWEAAKHPFQSFTVGVKILVKCETPFKWTLPIFKATLLKAGDPSAATIVFFFSPFRSTWNTGYITCLVMCKVCTEAVHSVALWTRVTLHVWACVKYVPKQSIP